MLNQPDPQPSSEEARLLRQRAEARFAECATPMPEREMMRIPEATQQLLHELQVHQIELEMQNDELRRAQLALDRSQARYFDFYDMAPVGYCTVDAEGLISQANLTMANMVGATRDRLIFQPMHHFIQKEDQDSFYLFRKQLLESGDSLVSEMRMRRADGTSFWASLAAMVVPNESGARTLRMVLSDITERKQAEEKVQLAASVFTHAREGIMITERDGTIIDVNDAFTRITGYSRDEVWGKTRASSIPAVRPGHSMPPCGAI